MPLFIKMLLVLITIPLILPVLLLLIIWRLIIIKLAMASSSQFVRAIDGLDYAFCVDSLYTRPKAGTSFIWILEGSLEPQKVLQRFEKVLENDESHNYEKLKSIYPSFWMGVPFWTKVEEEFRMENHFRVINVLNENFQESKKLNAMLVEWMRQGFQKGRPLWEIMVIQELILAGEKRSILGLKIHHMIGDGYSKLRLLEKIVDKPPIKMPNLTTYPPPSLKLPIKSQTFLSLPYTLSRLFQDFVLHKDIWTRKKSSAEVALFTATFPMDSLKKVRKFYQHKFEDAPPPPLVLVGVNILAGALRKFLIQQNKEIPVHSNIVVALPHTDYGHPGDFKFCNFWTHAILNVNVGEECATKRLQALMDNYEVTVKEKGWPQVYYRIVIPLQSLLPTWVWDKVTKFNMGAAIGSTNMVGPAEEVKVCGRRVLQKFAYVGLLWRHSSMTCGFFSYNGNLSATLLANQDVLTNTEQDELILNSFFQQEIDQLISELGNW